MLAPLVILVGLILYAIAYWGYGKWFDKNVIESDPTRVTPAHTYMDGVEFFPTNKYVLFGFHAKSIAGLGPIVGPIVAAQFGWLPALLWILFGNIFIGWIHDYMSLMVSVRSDGASFGPITYKLISPRARKILLAFVVFYLYLLLAGFVPILAGVLEKTPVAPIPTLITTVAGVLLALLTYKLRVNIIVSTIIALVLSAVGIWLGTLIPIYADTLTWTFCVLVFCYLGAVLPIWVFLQPVNYLSFYLVYFTVFGAIIGSFIGAPTFVQPAGPFLEAPAGFLWPTLFVTIACGAISGWHSLVSSSASSKQLDNEADGLVVGGGSMFFEGILALASLVCVAILAVEAPWKLGAKAFVDGAAMLLGYLGLPPKLAVATTATAVFICGITLAHLALRILRLFQSEVAGPRFGGLFRNIYASAFIASLIAGFLAVTGTWMYIWVLFGSSNQLMAGLALLIATLWLVRQKKPAYFTGIPMVFMIVTTVAALIVASQQTLANAATAKTLAAAIGNAAAGLIGVVLVILALVMIYEGYKAWSKSASA